MNQNEFDRAARAWLDDGPNRMSDRALLSALEEVHTTRQRRALWPAWRPAPASTFASVAVAAVLVVGIGLFAGNVVRRQPDGPGVGGPSSSSAANPTPGSSPSSSPTQEVDIPDPGLTRTFVSTTSGFSIEYTDRGEGTITPATERWVSGDRATREAFDAVETGLGAVFLGASTKVPDELIPEGLLPDGWIDDEWVDSVIWNATGCALPPRSQQEVIFIFGRSGRIAECPGEPSQIVATVVEEDQLYQFTLLHSRSDGRAVFDDFEASIRLHSVLPRLLETMTTPFVSATNGYSMEYSERGGLMPATTTWDPASGAPFDAAFDGVETGALAFFKGGSTQIPEGVVVDDWIETTLANMDWSAARSCYLPPGSPSSDISIDGQPGRLRHVPQDGWICSGRFEATVVAGGRLYVFILQHSWDEEAIARAIFDAFIDTIDLRPEDAPVPSSSPSP